MNTDVKTQAAFKNSNSNNDAFASLEEWASKQDELVDVKFCLGNVNSDKTISRNVINAFLSAEKMIEASITEPHLSGV